MRVFVFISPAFSDFEMDKIAWQKKSRPASDFAIKNI